MPSFEQRTVDGTVLEIHLNLYAGEQTMRAICGAIIAAGALIGLGLTALAYGVRFQTYGPNVINPNSNQIYGVPSLTLILVLLAIFAGIGLGIAFLGLAFHHERRYYESLREKEGSGRRTVPMS
jgi:hypothetical protein